MKFAKELTGQELFIKYFYTVLGDARQLEREVTNHLLALALVDFLENNITASQLSALAIELYYGFTNPKDLTDASRELSEMLWQMAEFDLQSKTERNRRVRRFIEQFRGRRMNSWLRSTTRERVDKPRKKPAGQDTQNPEPGPRLNGPKGIPARS